MKKDNRNSESHDLRQKAEALLKKKSVKAGSHLSEIEIYKLNHELEVHQIELELQNEELKLSRSAAMETAEKFAELYDFAPMGYLTLSKDGKIMELNLLAAEMIGEVRSRLINRHFGVCISEKSKPVFNLFLDRKSTRLNSSH